ncbi:MULTISPECIES: hypothetical protein [unclassified Nonomuraea]|uniref:hypothetical protein n=1 Tax=unclassified Nonomuraea TaxID=2593643 RepID=UPI0033E4DD4C
MPSVRPIISVWGQEGRPNDAARARLLATGVSATRTKGLLSGGPIEVLRKQLTAIVVVGLYSFVVTYLIGRVVDRLCRSPVTCSPRP